MPEEHWSSTFEHESLATPEARESFTKAMGKYETQEEGVLGGFNAIKMTGQPYKLPESMDKLPEAQRDEFSANARKVLGIEGVKSIDDLADLNLREGLPEDAPINEALAETFKQFAVEKKLPKSVVKELIGFNNKTAMSMAKQQHDAQLETIKTTNEALIEHFGNEEAVAEKSELVKRWFKNQSGLTAEEYEAVGDELANSLFTKNPILSRVFMDHFAPLAAEGSTEQGKGGGGGKTPSLETQTVEEYPETSKALGWNE
jgi:hypothetical protein